MKDYSEMTDEKLIEHLQNSRDNDDMMDYILDKYKYIVKIKARAMFLIGGDTDDLIQEGMIGLYKAIRDFDLKKEVSFASFADLCITRQIYTAINSSNRKKHSPLNSYISFYSEDYNEMRNDDNNPESILIDKENVKVIEDRLNEALSSFEKQVLRLYMEGSGYVEIADSLEKTPKSVDNAIQRIKGKAADILRKL